MGLRTEKLDKYVWRTVTSIVLTISLPMLLQLSEAQETDSANIYKWKDEKGKMQISNKPPPPTCASQDCQKIFANSKQEQEKAERDKKRKYTSEAMWHERWKQETTNCVTGKEACTHEQLQKLLMLLSPIEIKKILGKPERIQRISVSYGIDIYW